MGEFGFGIGVGATAGAARRVPALLAAAVALCATSACTTTAGQTAPVLGLGPAIHDGGVVMPPPGWLDYCARNPKDVSCEAAQLDGARAEQLRTVQAALTRIARRDDQTLFGRSEYWQVADSRGGDCEDIALAARAKLLALGWPASALRLATVWTEQGEYHLVLTVDVAVQHDVATLVLDSRFSDVKSFGQLVRFGYRFDTRQAAHGATWVKIDATPMQGLPRQNPQLADLRTAALDRARARVPAVLAAGELPAPATPVRAVSPAKRFAGNLPASFVAAAESGETPAVHARAGEAELAKQLGAPRGTMETPERAALLATPQAAGSIRIAYQDVVPQTPLTR